MSLTSSFRPTSSEPAVPTGLQFGEPEMTETRALLARAIAEDLPGGDVTTEALFPARSGARSPGIEVAFSARTAGILCGVPVVQELFRTQAPAVTLQAAGADGAKLQAGESFLVATGRAREILPLERIALNFLQRLSGVATQTRRYLDAIRNSGVTLLDTRKTTPGWRHLEKYAVRAGGGTNHRRSLSEAVLLKDNHLGVLRAQQQGHLGDWIRVARQAAPGLFLEVEVDSREQFLEALAAAPTAILLDNFAPEDIRWAVRERNARGREPLLEASGGIQLDNIGAVALTGVDRISVGALTHSAPAVDIGLDLRRVF